MQKHACLTAGILVAALGIAESAAAETLQDALISAYTTNPTLQAFRARLRATDEAVPQALANWRPTVKLTGDYNKFYSHTTAPTTTIFGEATTSDVTSAYTAKDLGVSIVQPIYRGGQTVAQTKQAEAQVEADRALLAVQEQTVLLNAITAYMNVVQARAVLDLSINNEQVLQRQLDATNDRFRVGEVTRTDVAQAESRLSAAHADRTQAQGNLEGVVATYIDVIGHAPENLMTPGPVAGLPPSVDAAREQALGENPNILNAQHTYDAATYGVDLLFGQLLPTVSLTGQAVRNIGFQGPATSERVGVVTLNLTVPIYQQGAEYSRVRAQKHTAGQARITVDVTRRDTVQAVTQAWESLQTARARIASYTDQIRAAEVALEGVQRESQVGSRTVLDVLNAEQELLTARVNLVQAQHDETVAAYTLKNAVGQLTARALALPVAIYDPVKHYEEVRDKMIGTGVSPAYGDEGK
jgi:outer membrane protein